MDDKKQFRVISSKDVMTVLDISIRQAQRVLRKIRGLAGKEKRQPVMVWEFCCYAGFKIEQVYALLDWNNLNN